MAKFNFSITAHTRNDMMCIYSADYFTNITEFGGRYPIFSKCCEIMGFRDWTFDDGDDSKGTNYCQYVSYDNDNHNNYLLAVWCEIDEESGCMKL